MTTWSSVRTMVSTWVGTVTGLPVVWQHTSDENMWVGAGRVIASVTGGANVGIHDTVVQTYDPLGEPGEELLVSVIGHRTYTLGFTVEVYDQRADLDALYYTGLIRTSVRAPSIVDAFRAVDVGFASVLVETMIDSSFERVWVSRAQLDLRINTAQVFDDAPITYIETLADAEMEVNGPAGTPVITHVGDMVVG